MRFRTALSLATLFVVFFAVAAWSSPVPDRLFPSGLAGPSDNQSLSGKISSVGDASFSLEVSKGQERKTVDFLIDGETKVEGKLEIGSQAMVEYRPSGGKNLAVRVVVTPSSGMHSR